MPENLMIQPHRSSTPSYREGWDRTFKQQDDYENYLLFPSSSVYEGYTIEDAKQIRVKKESQWQKPKEQNN